MTLTILEGATFCISDDCGDVADVTHGLFSDDTRHLSRFVLTINGARPLPLSSGRPEYFSAGFYLRNPITRGLAQDTLAISRTRFVGTSLQELVGITNLAMTPISIDLSLQIEVDFADILSVKEHDFALGHPATAARLPAPVPAGWSEDRLVATFSDREDATEVIFSVAPDDLDAGVVWRLALPPRGRWELEVDVVPNRSQSSPEERRRRFGAELEHVRASLRSWNLHVPRLDAAWVPLGRSFQRSVADLASLRMADRSDVGKLPAAGMPWFMTVFGRDTVITCLQTLLFGPELAQTALRVLARLQAQEEDPSIDAEPGKIVHEVRHGKAAARWFPRYYGTVDATLLFLVLLHEVWQWTDDGAFVEELRTPALLALQWIDRYGDRDGDGFVEFERRAPGGLPVQSWKDSPDSQRFADGRIAAAPIAPVEVQGYVYDAKLRLAEIAREVWREPELAARLERDADRLRGRFDEAFWIDDRGHYALALDGDKQQVDSLTSNVGHLLWSGIVRPERLDPIVARLFSADLWSGWGVRTMSAGATAFNPLSYHNGTVWPHDNALIAWGLERSGRTAEARTIARALLEAAAHFEFELPEVFAGFSRDETPFPIAYPTAARPQAWAAGTPILLLQLLLGIRPDRRQRLLRSETPVADASLGPIALRGVPAFGRTWDVTLEEGTVRVA